MKKCKTEKELISQENKKNNKKSLNLKALLSKIPKIPKIIIQIPLNNPNIDIQKNHKKIFTSFLMNNSYTISNIENTNPNYMFSSLSNSHRAKIYQKKKIPVSQKANEENKKHIFSIKKKLNLNLKESDNTKGFKNSIRSRKNYSNNIISTEGQKYFLNDSKITHQIKKYYLNNKLNLDKNNTMNEGITLENEINTDRYKRININNININLNSINKITNKIEYGDINNNLNSSRSYLSKINDIHFLKRLNFDQPKINKNNNNFNEVTLNNQNKILDRIKLKKNFVYKNIKKSSKNKNSDKNNNILNKLKLKKINSNNMINKKSNSFKQNLDNKKQNIITSKTKDKNKSLNNNNENKKNKKVENFEQNLITSESLTILDNSISYSNTFGNDSKELTQSLSEKDEKHKVISSHQLNIFLNNAKKPINHMKRTKPLEFKNIFFSSINTNFKLLLIKFMDKKSLLVLSSLNKTFYNNLRKKIYKFFYDKIIKNNGNRDYILKILSSLQKYASSNLKSNNKNNLKIKYDNYKRCKSKYDLIIVQDISRTFPLEPNFSVNSINYKKLYNILTAYSNFNKNIGYAQGLNFLAARSIILFKNEENVFLFLDGLINKFNLGYFLSINNQKLSKQIKYLSQILNKYCKNFINYLKSKLINHDFFTTSWLLTLFSCSMEKKKLYICWSFMTIFGWKFFYSFIIQIILFYENNLVKINEGKLSKQMKELLKSNTFIKDFNTIIKNTFSFMESNIVL